MPTTGTTTQRGYDTAHKQVRARWQRRLDNGERVVCRSVRCLQPGHLVDPKRWHLGHTPDRSGWTGPEVPECNLSEGAERGNRTRARPRGRAGPRGERDRHSRAW